MVIKRGWDAPVSSHVRGGARGATYLAYRKALQEVVSKQLAAWGDSHADSSAPPRSAKLDRDLARVLEDLADEFPLLHSLVERRRGGQKRLPMGDRDTGGGLHPLYSVSDAAEPEARRQVPENDHAGERLPADPSGPTDPEGSLSPHPESARLPGAGGKSRRATYGLSIQFESRADDDELGRLVENTVWVNDAHPAFRRAVSSRSLGYHLALTVALALAPLAVASTEEHFFVTRFLAEWGNAQPAHAHEHRSRQTRSRDRRT